MTTPVTEPLASPASDGSSWLHGLEAAVVPAAQAVAGLLPSVQPLAPGVPQTAADLDLAGWPAAAVATLSSAPGASVAVLVRRDLADALAGAPSGALDVGAAVQPALDAAATALGSSAGAGRTVDGAELAQLVAGATVAVPLLAGAGTAAVLVVTVTGAQAGVATGGPSARPGSGQGAQAGHTVAGVRGVELLHGVAMEVTVELGRTRLSVRELLALCPGDVLELDRAAGSPADLLVNGRLIARGEVVVVDEDFALRVTEIVAQPNAS
jgi:flagellar motor switch protein FliN/FliY